MGHGLRCGSSPDSRYDSSARLARDPLRSSEVRERAGRGAHHLHEQPVLFYALVAIAQLAGTATDFTVICAWVYVGARVVHSLFQALVNFVPVRFGLFLLASVPLFLIAGEQALALFG